jgi:hypothetical protein
MLDKLVEIDWVGAKNPKGAQGYNTGASGLDSTYNVLRANPGLMARPVVLLYDNDTNKPDSVEGKLLVRRVPGGPMNTRVRAGIESLLPDVIFEDKFNEKSEQFKSNGDLIVRTTLKKMELCRNICRERQRPEDFEGFEPLLDMLEQLAREMRCAREEPQAPTSVPTG